MGCLVPKIPSTGDAQLTCIVYTMHIVVVQLKPGSQACRCVRAAKNPDNYSEGCEGEEGKERVSGDEIVDAGVDATIY